jgi:hypothetical protein
MGRERQGCELCQRQPKPDQLAAPRPVQFSVAADKLCIDGAAAAASTMGIIRPL